MRRLLSIFAFFTALGIAPASYSAENGTADEAVALVHRVIAYIKANGEQKAFAEINDQRSKLFVDRDLYIVINDLNGKNLAHGGNQKMVGKDLAQLKDADGKAFVKESIELVKAKSKGWVDFRWPNPATKELQQKSAYFEKYENLLIGCGIYK